MKTLIKFILVLLFIFSSIPSFSSPPGFFCKKGKPRCSKNRRLARCKDASYKPTCLRSFMRSPDCCREESDENSVKCKPELLTCNKKSPKPETITGAIPFCSSGQMKCDDGTPSCTFSPHLGKPKCTTINDIDTQGCLNKNAFYPEEAKCTK